MGLRFCAERGGGDTAGVDQTSGRLQTRSDGRAFWTYSALHELIELRDSDQITFQSPAAMLDRARRYEVTDDAPVTQGIGGRFGGRQLFVIR